MEWLNDLNKAVEYIEEHLEQEISFDEVARMAGCSTYYFQRIFSYVAGISLAEYIRRRRMTQAAFELQRTDKRVSDISAKYGYASPASSTWVVFENDGYFKESVQSVFRRFYTEWLPFSGYEYAGLPDIEVYPIQNKTIQCGRSEVWIAVKKKSRRGFSVPGKSGCKCKSSV